MCPRAQPTRGSWRAHRVYGVAMGTGHTGAAPRLSPESETVSQSITHLPAIARAAAPGKAAAGSWRDEEGGGEGDLCRGRNPWALAGAGGGGGDADRRSVPSVPLESFGPRRLKRQVVGRKTRRSPSDQRPRRSGPPAQSRRLSGRSRRECGSRWRDPRMPRRSRGGWCWGRVAGPAWTRGERVLGTVAAEPRVSCSPARSPGPVLLTAQVPGAGHSPQAAEAAAGLSGLPQAVLCPLRLARCPRLWQFARRPRLMSLCIGDAHPRIPSPRTQALIAPPLVMCPQRLHPTVARCECGRCSQEG